MLTTHIVSSILTTCDLQLTTILLFLDFSGGELFIIFLAVFILFGPKKMPEIARRIGKFINEIKRASEKIKTEITDETDKINNEIKDVKDKTSDFSK